MNRNGRSNQRTSRFGPPTSGLSGMELPQLLPSGNSYRSVSSQTPEQIAFEMEFNKWEAGFEDWKRSWSNHPDRAAYKQYEQKFLDVREKLMSKRAQIYGHTYAESQLQNQLMSASAMAESILSKFSEPANFNQSQQVFDNRDDDRMNRSRSPINRNPSGRAGQTSYFNRSPPRQPFVFEERDRRGISSGQDRRGFSSVQDRKGFSSGQDRRSDSGGQRRGNAGSSGGLERSNSNRREDNYKKQRREDNYKKQEVSAKQLKKELNRKDVYPNSPWQVFPSSSRF